MPPASDLPWTYSVSAYPLSYTISSQGHTHNMHTLCSFQGTFASTLQQSLLLTKPNYLPLCLQPLYIQAPSIIVTISMLYKTAFKFTLGPAFSSNPLYFSLHYHPELLLGSRGRFPDNGRRDEAKHTLTSRAKTWTFKTKRFALSIFAILPP